MYFHIIDLAIFMGDKNNRKKMHVFNNDDSFY